MNVNKKGFKCAQKILKLETRNSGHQAEFFLSIFIHRAFAALQLPIRNIIQRPDLIITVSVIEMTQIISRECAAGSSRLESGSFGHRETVPSSIAVRLFPYRQKETCEHKQESTLKNLGSRSCYAPPRIHGMSNISSVWMKTSEMSKMSLARKN